MFKFFDDFHLGAYLDLSLDFFRLTFIHILKHGIWKPLKFIDPKDSTNKFPPLFLVFFYIVV